MKVKIEFELEESKEYIVFEGELEEKENMFGELICFKNRGENYVYPIGSMKMYIRKGNVLCAERVKLKWLNVEYKFE